MTARQLLSGNIDVPEFADQLIDTITRRSGTAEEWLAGSDDVEEERGESRGYEFGSQFAQGGAEVPVARERAGSVARVKGFVGIGGRSRSSSSVQAPVQGGREVRAGFRRFVRGERTGEREERSGAGEAGEWREREGVGGEEQVDESEEWEWRRGGAARDGGGDVVGRFESGTGTRVEHEGEL